MQNRNTPLGAEFYQPFFNQSLGLENIFNSFNEFQKPNSKYPPYNIIKMNDSYTIEFALAGWKMDDLKIELEKNVLTVSGNNDTLETDYERQQEFVHRGIANRSFTNQFTIGDRVQVDSAQLNDGMLIIGLTVVIPEEDRPLTIPINSTNELLIES